MKGGSGWKGFFRKHRGALAAFVVIIIALVAWSVYVFWWFTGNAQSSGLVPSILGLWTTGNLVNFILFVIFYEAILVGIPAVIFFVAAWRWWKKLPAEELMGYRWWRSRSTRGGGGAGFLLWLAFIVKVYFDGNWNVPIGLFSLNYVVGSVITILEIAAIVLGIPAAIALAWWLNREMKAEPAPPVQPQS